MEYISPVLRSNFREFCTIYLSLKNINAIFQMAEIQPGESKTFVSGERRSRVEDYYASIDWSNFADTQKFLKVIELILSQAYISDEAKDGIRSMCAQENLIVKGYQVEFPKLASSDEPDDLFVYQFPAGLPFGVKKPSFSVTAREKKQSLKFELEAGIGIIWQDVYPNFDFLTFQDACGITPETNLALKKSLASMNQTDCEKTFFLTYANDFKMADKRIPMLIPQAWIQWHSLPKKVLESSGNHLAKEPFRIDFVAFWNNQRYAIFIDDIGHYAVKYDNKYIADEEKYTQHLEEDRKLQIEGWKIFRISNWEIKQGKTKDITLDLQRFIGFE